MKIIFITIISFSLVFIPYENKAFYITDGSGFQAIACGYRHSLALKKDGTVWACCGGSPLGDGTMFAKTTAGSVSVVVGILDTGIKY